MEDVPVLSCLLGVLDTLGKVSRAMHPGRLAPLIETLGDQDARLSVAAAGSEGQVALAASLALQACAGLRAAPQADNPTMQAYRAMRQYSRSLEALAPLAETVPAISRYLLEPQSRDDPTLMQRLAEPPHPDSGAFHFDNQTDQRGGF
jgi:phospholipase/carboxylesterase